MLTCGDNGGSRDYDYNNLPGGECVASDGGVGACTTIPEGGDMQQACAAKCDETTPGWVAINYYYTEDALGAECCCQTSCDCSQPSTGGAGQVITQNVANLPTSFCPDGRVVMSGTCKRRRKYRSQRSRGRGTQEEEMDRMHAQVALHHRRGLFGYWAR